MTLSEESSALDSINATFILTQSLLILVLKYLANLTKGLRFISFGNNGFILFSETDQISKKESEINDKQDVQEEETNEDSIEEDIEPEPETTLYVKNLNFDSTDESIKKVNI